MPRRRRITVAFQQVETTPMRQFRCASTGVWDLRRMPIMRTRADELNEDGEGEGYYWCAADRPTPSDTATGLMLRPVYAGTKGVPESARCEACGIGIRELQESMGSLTSPRQQPTS